MIIKPKIDDREYKLIQLPNKLDVLIVRDKDKKVASACMTVNVGHYHDPDNFHGMAHFLEHMLFMGTKKYPTENHFNDFISTHGGSSNAFTAPEMTSYFFDILSDHFEEGLDIFAHFFIDPILSKSAVDREINAVNSEHEKNIPQDIPWRLSSILRVLAKNEHPMSKFGTGNLKTLKKDGLYDELKRFHDKYYSSNIMKLVVYWDKSISEIEKVVEKIFCKVPNYNVHIDKIKIRPFPTDKSNLCKVVPIADEQTLVLFWQMKSTYHLYKYNPLQFVSYLLNFEHDGSLSTYLKNNGYVIDINWFVFEDIESAELFGCIITLTDKGFQHIPTIIDLAYDYLETIAKHKDYERLYDEFRQISRINFDYQNKTEPINYVNDLCLRLLKFPPNDVVSAGSVLDKFNDKIPNIIRDNILSEINKKNQIIIIFSKSFSGELKSTEKWYGVEYSSYTNIKDLLKGFKKLSVNEKFSLPEPNKFIPQNFKLIGNDKVGKFPVKLHDQIWYKGDKLFKIPKVIMGVSLATDNIYKSPKTVVLANLFLIAVNRILSSILYYGSISGSTFSATNGNDRLNLYFESYSDKIELYCKTIADYLFDLKIDKSVFDYSMNLLENRIESSMHRMPYLISNDMLNSIIVDKYYDIKKLNAAFKKVKYEDIKNYNLMEYITDKKFIVQGNIKKEDVNKLVSIVNDKIVKINGEGLNLSIKELSNGVQLRYNKKPYNEQEHNYCVNYFVEIEKITKSKTDDWEYKLSMIHFISLIISDKFFNELRSKRQTGYVVRSFVNSFSDSKDTIFGISFMIQSSSYDTKEIEKRINQFIKTTMLKILKDISEKKFNKYVVTFIKRLKEKDNNLIEEFMRNFDEVIKNTFAFDFKDKLIKKVSKFTKDDILDYYDRYFVSKSKKVRVISINPGKKN